MEPIRSRKDPRLIALAAVVAAVLYIGLTVVGLPTPVALAVSIFLGAMTPQFAAWWIDSRATPPDPLAEQ